MSQQIDLMDALSKALDGKNLNNEDRTDPHLKTLHQILKDRATLKRLDAMTKKIKLRIESETEGFLETHSKNGTFVLGDIAYTIENKMPDCRPKWKDEFVRLAVACKLNPTVYVNKVITQTKAALKSYRVLSLKKIKG